MLSHSIWVSEEYLLRNAIWVAEGWQVLEKEDDVKQDDLKGWRVDVDLKGSGQSPLSKINVSSHFLTNNVVRCTPTVPYSV